MFPLVHFVEEVTFTLVSNGSSVFSSLHLHWIGSRVTSINHFQSSNKWFRWLNEISILNIWESLFEFKNISSIVIEGFKIFKSKIVTHSIVSVFPLFKAVGRANDDIKNDFRFIITDNFFTSLNSGNKVSVVNCSSIHNNHTIGPFLRWENKWNRSTAYNSF